MSFKKLLLLILTLFIFSACQNQPQTSDTTDFTNSSNLQRYQNKKYGYTIELPKTWGAIQPYGASFTELYEDLETIGPNLPTAFDDDRNKYYLDIEVFSDQTNQRQANETWLDWYKKLRIKNEKYESMNYVNDRKYKVTEITLFDEKGDYKRSCNLLEKNNKLYTFCFNRNNNIHTEIIQSIELG